MQRREFLVTKLAAGFALAVQPIRAAAISTSADGLDAGEIKIPVQGGTIPGYRAVSNKGGRYPVVLVVQEIFGVHEHIRDLCRRLAKAGYCAVAPELYARQGDVSKMQDVNEIVTKVVSRVPDAQVMGDLDATVVWARKNAKGSPDKLAITGFCWGGRIVWMYAAHNQNLKAGAAWYGRLEGAPTDMSPRNPLDVAGVIKAPIIGFYAGKDTGIPQESVEKMRATMSVLKVPSEINVYPNAEHGFNADYRPSYNEQAATDAWAKMLAWFKKNGV